MNYTYFDECSQLTDPAYYPDTTLTFTSNCITFLPDTVFNQFVDVETIDLHGNLINNGKAQGN